MKIASGPDPSNAQPPLCMGLAMKGCVTMTVASPGTNPIFLKAPSIAAAAAAVRAEESLWTYTLSPGTQ